MFANYKIAYEKGSIKIYLIRQNFKEKCLSKIA